MNEQGNLHLPLAPEASFQELLSGFVKVSPQPDTDVDLGIGDHSDIYTSAEGKNAQHQNTEEGHQPVSSSFTSPNFSKAHQTCQSGSVENTFYDENDPIAKRKMAEQKVEKLKQECAEVTNVICKQCDILSPENRLVIQRKIQELIAKEQALKGRLLSAQIHLADMCDKEQAAKYADLKNTIQFYAEEIRRIRRGYSEETLLGIDIPMEFQSVKQKTKYLSAQIQSFRKEKKSVQKERIQIYIHKEVKLWEKANFCWECHKSDGTVW